MAVKTITVTNEAYDALKSLKGIDESFSQTILRVAKRKPLSYFFGILSGKEGNEFEHAIRERRKEHAASRQSRRERLSKQFEEE